jgi:amino acid adenylation domain-containing protein
VALSTSEIFLRTGPYDVVDTVVETLFQHAFRQPDSIALIDGRDSLTYAQLGRTVLHLGERLQLLGVRRGDRVGIALEPSVATICVILALHSCGAAYVPLSDSQPLLRICSMVDDASVTIVVTQDLATSVFDELGIKRIDMTALSADLNGIFEVSSRSETQLALVPPTSPLDLSPADGAASDTAYVIFTSGSTGRPKGVQVTHKNLDALMQAWDRVMGSTRHVSLLLSALTFDASVAELFWPLHHGGTLVIASKADAHQGGEGLGNLIRKHNISHLQCTPTRATLLLADPCDRAALAHIKHLVIGGEALTRSLARLLLDAGIERITNAYGPTEATVWAFTQEVTSDLPTEVVGIGDPLSGITAAIVDCRGNDITEIGMQGELVLGGPFVASGYVGRDELSAERFFSRSYHHAGESVPSYRTGDRVARNANGTFAFHGRSDDQVKIRGHRIELGEIEAALGAHCGVQQSVVCVQERNGSNELVALVVAHAANKAKLQAQDLRVHLKDLLPAVMVPSRIVLVAELPLTSASKIDRVRAREEILPSIQPVADQDIDDLSPSAGNRQSSPPDGHSKAPIEAMILDFAHALGLSVDPTINAELAQSTASSAAIREGSPTEILVGRNTNFFAAGGHSMFAVALLARIEDRTGVRLPIRELLSSPTPEQLLVVMQRHLADPAQTFDPLVRFRLSSAKRRLYLIHGAGGNVLRYRNLARALNDVVDVVGIQAIGVEPGNQPDLTLAAMVERYVGALLATGDQDFELGGYSDGGIVAIHVAHRLVQAGRSVRSLTLLDAFLPITTNMGLPAQLANIRFSFSSRHTLPLAKWLRGSLIGWRRRCEWDREGPEALRRLGYVDIYALNERAVQHEALPTRFSAPVLVVRTFEETPTRRRNYDIGYDPEQATVAWVHGPHDELLKPPSIPELELGVRAFLASV